MSTPGSEEPYELVLPGPVSRAVREELPEAVAWAVIEFAHGPDRTATTFITRYLVGCDGGNSLIAPRGGFHFVPGGRVVIDGLPP